MVLALASILVSLLLTFVGVLMAIAGLVLGIIASRREPYAKGFWLTGIIVGAVVALLVVGGTIFLFAVMFSGGFGY